MQMTLLGRARVWLNVLNRHFGMCPKTDMPAHHSTWELQQACAYSSESLYPTALQQSRIPFPGQALKRASLAEGIWDELHQSPLPPLHSLTSPEAAARVLEAVTQTLTQYPFDFRGARILSGQDEGVLGWVTANYLLENFIKVGPASGPENLVACQPCLLTVLIQPLFSTVRLGRPVDKAKEGNTGGYGPWGCLYTDHLRDSQSV